MTNEETKLATFIGNRLDKMLAHPKLWGSAEAFEMQVLVLLEVNEHLHNRITEADGLRDFIDRYSTFMRMRVRDLGARPLCTVVTDVFKIAALLSEFRTNLEDW